MGGGVALEMRWEWPGDVVLEMRGVALVGVAWERDGVAWE